MIQADIEWPIFCNEWMWKIRSTWSSCLLKSKLTKRWWGQWQAPMLPKRFLSSYCSTTSFFSTPFLWCWIDEPASQTTRTLYGKYFGERGGFKSSVEQLQSVILSRCWRFLCFLTSRYHRTWRHSFTNLLQDGLSGLFLNINDSFDLHCLSNPLLCRRAAQSFRLFQEPFRYCLPWYSSPRLPAWSKPMKIKRWHNLGSTPKQSNLITILTLREGTK